jgi:hypothetical protein
MVRDFLCEKWLHIKCENLEAFPDEDEWLCRACRHLPRITTENYEQILIYSGHINAILRNIHEFLACLFILL